MVDFKTPIENFDSSPCEDVKDLERREKRLEGIVEKVKDNPILSAQHVPESIFLMRERKRLIGLKFKEKIQLQKLKMINSAIKRQIRKAIKSVKHKDIKIIEDKK